MSCLIYTKANSVDNNFMTFFLFLQETGFDISCKLYPLETVCMECQTLIPGKENTSKYCLLKILTRMPSVAVAG